MQRYVIHGDKKRDWATGKILGLDVTGYPPKGGKVLMIDDICSYGGTMFYSAKKLKELGCWRHQYVCQPLREQYPGL